MKLATIRTGTTTHAVVVVGEELIEIAGYGDVGALLADDQWRERSASAAAGSE